MLISEPQLTAHNGESLVYAGVNYTYPIVKELQTGVYDAGLNPGMCRMDYESYPVLGEVEVYSFGSIGSFNAYGVCDNYQQILDQCKELVDSPTRQFVITLAEMCKEDQEPDGGWRWHKWGPYIGTQEPTTEYLFDEPIIERVFCFHIYEKKILTKEGK